MLSLQRYLLQKGGISDKGNSAIWKLLTNLLDFFFFVVFCQWPENKVTNTFSFFLSQKLKCNLTWKRKETCTHDTQNKRRMKITLPALRLSLRLGVVLFLFGVNFNCFLYSISRGSNNNSFSLFSPSGSLLQLNVMWSAWPSPLSISPYCWRKLLVRYPSGTNHLEIINSDRLQFFFQWH